MPHNYKSGLGNSAAYMVSGQPWITGSADIGTGQEEIGRASCRERV